MSATRDEGRVFIDSGEDAGEECRLGDQPNPTVWDGVVTSEEIVLAGDAEDGPWVWTSSNGCEWTAWPLPVDLPGVGSADQVVVDAMAEIDGEVFVLGVDRSSEPFESVHWKAAPGAGGWVVEEGPPPVHVDVVPSWETDEPTVVVSDESGETSFVLPRQEPDLVHVAGTSAVVDDAAVVFGSAQGSLEALDTRDLVIMWRETDGAFEGETIASFPGTGIAMQSVVSFNSAVIVGGSYSAWDGPLSGETTPILLANPDLDP